MGSVSENLTKLLGLCEQSPTQNVNYLSCVCVCVCWLKVSVWRTQHSSLWTRGSDHHPYTFCVCVCVCVCVCMKERKSGIVMQGIVNIVRTEWGTPRLRAAFEEIA